MLRELRTPWVQAFAIGTIVDIGANVGQFASLARSAFPRAHIVCFEPLPDCVARLQRRFRNDDRFRAFPVAVGSEAAEREIFRSAYSPSSSFLQVEKRLRDAFPSAAATVPVRVKVERLDAVLEPLRLDGPLLLKIDAQGTELEVLRGARRTLERCSLILLEVSLRRLYVGEPLFAEVHQHLVANGFSLAGLAGRLRDPHDHRLLQLDAIFERDHQ
jgi:FkbM family methyltransferase